MVTAVLIPLRAGVVLGENVDPANNGSQYAWAENVGWINAEPLGNAGPGLQVNDFELTGYLWGENIGWINMSCKNGSTCGATNYGVVNDGHGVLSGYAWAENVGWINFKPETSGVLINVATGDFSGRAWGENIGWITFASSGDNPYKVQTNWTCLPAPAVPSGVPALSVGKSGSDTRLSWTGIAGATGYDIVKGDVATLTSSGGNFSVATQACLAKNLTFTSLTDSSTPPPAQAVWFLVRGKNCGGDGSYDTRVGGQVGLRDAEIAASGHDCH